MWMVIQVHIQCGRWSVLKNCRELASKSQEAEAVEFRMPSTCHHPRCSYEVHEEAVGTRHRYHHSSGRCHPTPLIHSPTHAHYGSCPSSTQEPREIGELVWQRWHLFVAYWHDYDHGDVSNSFKQSCMAHHVRLCWVYHLALHCGPRMRKLELTWAQLDGNKLFTV